MAFLIVGKTEDGKHIVRTEDGLCWRTTAQLEEEARALDDAAAFHAGKAAQIRDQLELAQAE